MSLVLDQYLCKIVIITTIYTVSFLIVIKFILQKVPLNCGLYLFLHSKVKSLGAADSDDDDSAAAWVAKSRKKENEKSLAEKRVSYHHSLHNLEKVLNFSSHLEKSLNLFNSFTFGRAKHSDSDRECKYFPLSDALSDLGSASDWSCRLGNLLQPIRSTAQIWVVTCHQYGISVLISQTSFVRGNSGGIVKWQLFSVFSGYSRYGNPL